MKQLKLRKNTYLWNTFWDEIFIPVSPGRSKETIYRSGTKRYRELAAKKGWREV